MLDPVTFNSLRRFRAGVYGAFGARRDALFELLDAATVAGLVPSLAHLSLTAVHRRRWGSLYDALPEVEELRDDDDHDGADQGDDAHGTAPYGPRVADPTRPGAGTRRRDAA